MVDFLTALGVAFGVIFVAELGDKSQLLALNFGARYPLRTVAAGLTVGYAAAGVIATVVGGLLGAAFPERSIEIVGGLVFLVFAALALRESNDDADDDDDDDDADAVSVSVARSVVVTIALTIAVAEMGDKTQIATATLAAQANPVATWIGATAGEVCSGMVGAVAGMALGDRVRPGVLRWISVVLFAVFGLVMLFGLL